MAVAALSLLLILIVEGATGGDPCPPRTDLRSCTCRQVALEVPPLLQTDTSQEEAVNATLLKETTVNGTTVDPTTVNPTTTTETTVNVTTVECRLPRTPQALQEAIALALHRRALDRLVLRQVPPEKERVLARLPPRLLRTARVRRLEIRDSVLSGDFLWAGDPLEGQGRSLLSLAVVGCRLSGALALDGPGATHTRGLDRLPLLRELDFSVNRIVQVSSSAFKGAPRNLSVVSLSHNAIFRVEGGSLAHLSGLADLDLSHNLLEAISRDALPSPAKQLRRINLSWNLLQTVGEGLFRSMPALRNLDLSRNFLFTMSQKTFAHVLPQLDQLSLAGNFIACDCELLWLLPFASQEAVNQTLAIDGYCTPNVPPPQRHPLQQLEREHIVC